MSARTCNSSSPREKSLTQWKAISQPKLRAMEGRTRVKHSTLSIYHQACGSYWNNVTCNGERRRLIRKSTYLGRRFDIGIRGLQQHHHNDHDHSLFHLASKPWPRHATGNAEKTVQPPRETTHFRLGSNRHEPGGSRHVEEDLKRSRNGTRLRMMPFCLVAVKYKPRTSVTDLLGGNGYRATIIPCERNVPSASRA